jgi:hypothetical protein
VVRRAGVDEIRQLEVGASAGLNLLVDRFCFSARGWQFGPDDSPVRFDDPIKGEVRPVGFTVVDRRGCDLHPVDPTSEEGRLLLTSFVWPFDVDRHQRLAAALAVAAEHPVAVDRAAAGDWLADRMGAGGDDVLTVVWHSVTRLYWPAAEVEAVEEALAAYGLQHRLARVAMEFGTDPDAPAMPEVRTTLWTPGDGVQHHRIGTAHHHGVPVRLEAPEA